MASSTTNLANSAGWIWIGPTSMASSGALSRRLNTASTNSTPIVGTYRARARSFHHS
jgi:hypothetical protein